MALFHKILLLCKILHKMLLSGNSIPTQLAFPIGVSFSTLPVGILAAVLVVSVPVAVLPVLLIAGAVVDLRGADGFRPVVGPVEVVRVPRVGVLPTENHAVDEAAHERDEAED